MILKICCVLSHFSLVFVFHIENSHLFYSAKHMTNFYVKRNAGLMGVGTLSIRPCFAFLGIF